MESQITSSQAINEANSWLGSNILLTEDKINELESIIQNCQFKKEELVSYLEVLEEWIRKNSLLEESKILRVILQLYDAGNKSAKQQVIVMEEVLEFPGDKEVEKLMAYLETAKEIIRVWVYFFTNWKIWEVIKRRLEDGVEVRIITDKDSKGAFGMGEEWKKSLKCHHLPIPEESKMHHKFVIIDDNLVMNGSFNWTKSAESKNLENVIVSSSKTLINAFIEIFDRYWCNAVFQDQE